MWGRCVECYGVYSMASALIYFLFRKMRSAADTNCFCSTAKLLPSEETHACCHYLINTAPASTCLLLVYGQFARRALLLLLLCHCDGESYCYYDASYHYFVSCCCCSSLRFLLLLEDFLSCRRYCRYVVSLAAQAAKEKREAVSPALLQ